MRKSRKGSATWSRHEHRCPRARRANPGCGPAEVTAGGRTEDMPLRMSARWHSCHGAVQREETGQGNDSGFAVHLPAVGRPSQRFSRAR